MAELDQQTDTKPWEDFQTGSETKPWEDFAKSKPTSRLDELKPPPPLEVPPALRGMTPEQVEAYGAIEKYGPFTQQLAEAGKGARALLADIGTMPSREPGEENMPNVLAAAEKRKLPVDIEMEQAGKTVSLPYKAAGSLIEAAPRMAGVAALQAGGVPAPVGAAAMFGFDESGKYNPKDVAVAAALPFVGKYGGQLAELIASKFKVPAGTAMNLIKAGGGIGAANAYLGVIQSSEIANLPSEQRVPAILDAVANDLGQSMLGVTELHGARTAPGRINLEKGQPWSPEASQRLEELAQQARALTKGETLNAPTTLGKQTGVQPKREGNDVVGVPTGQGAGGGVPREAQGGRKEGTPKEELSPLEQKLQQPLIGKNWTKEALQYGAGLDPNKPEAYDELKGLEAKYAQELKDIPKTAENFDKISQVGNRKQWITEAIQAAEGLQDRDTARALLGKDYKPPFPKTQRPAREIPPLDTIEDQPVRAKAAAQEYHINQDVLDTGKLADGKKASKKYLVDLAERQKQVVSNYKAALAESPRDQLLQEAEADKAKVKSEYPPIYEKMQQASGLSRKELDALNIPHPDEGPTSSEVKNIGQDLARNAPGGRLNKLYDLFAGEGKTGRFVWGGTADNPTLGFEADTPGARPDPVAARKALDAVNKIRGVFGFEPLPDFFKTAEPAPKPALPPREIPKPQRLKNVPYKVRKTAVEYHANQDLLDGGVSGPERDRLMARQKELVAEYQRSQDPSRIGGKGINRWYYHPSGQNDILDDINDLGGIATPSQSRFANKGDYDGYKEAFGIGIAKRLRRSEGGLPPDKVVQGLQKLEGKSYGKIQSTSDLYDAVQKAVKARQGVEGAASREQKIIEIESKQAEDFSDEVKNPKNKGASVAAGDVLAVGSEFKFRGEKFKVTEYDPDSDTYVVEDGQRFGRQFLSADESFDPDPGSVKGEPSAEFVPPEEQKGEFKLGAPETPEEQAAREAKEADAKAAKEAEDAKAAEAAGRERQERERLAGRIGGDLGEAGQGGLFEEPGQEEMFKPPPPGAGPGGTVPEDVGGQPQLAQLTQSLQTLAEQSKTKPQVRKAYSLGQKMAAIKNAAGQAMLGLRTAGNYMLKVLQGKPVVTKMNEILGQRHLELSESIANARDFLDNARKAVPKMDRREAISNWLDMGGDDAKLAQAERETAPQYKKGYADARNLTPEEKIIAQNIKNYFEARLREGRSAGVLDSAISDYIHRMYERESDWKKSVLAELTQGISTRKPGLAMKRVFEYDYEAEKAGYKPIKDFAQRVAEYDVSLNKAIADRKAVKAMLELKMPDKRPMIDVAGLGKEVTADDDEGSKSLIINPKAKVSGRAKGGAENPVNNRADYQHRDYPALKKWRWVDTDENGKDTIVQGDVLIHPDALGRVESLFERSKIRKYAVGRAALAVSSTFKQTAFDLSGFHPVQITVHGWEHRTFRPVEKIDFNNPSVRGLIKGGMTVGETDGWGLFQEGLTGSSLTRHIPVVGPKLQDLNEALFNDYIPRLKTAMALRALERNRARFPNLSEAELHKLTANQANAAFGGLNWEMMGVSRTTRDVFRLALVAPDFLIARGKFVAQAGTVYGREQLSALMLGAATLYVTARILNKLMDDKYHFELKNAFNLVHGGKAYSLRTVQGDLMHLAFEPTNFIYHRINPVFGRTFLEKITNRDEFGRKRTIAQQMGDFAKNIVPISTRGLLNSREQSLLESALNAFGITERRNTDIDNVYALAENYKKANNIPEPAERIYDPDQDPYRGIKLAGLYGTPEKTADEIRDAIKGRKLSAQQLFRHFEGYVSRPFTGSKQHEARFIAGLTADQKKIYMSAIDERKKLIINLQKGWQIYQAQK